MTLKHFAVSLRVVAFASLAGFAATARPCDTWVAMQNATADHSVILGKNSDRPPMEAQPLVQVPHQKHDASEKVKCTCLGGPPYEYL